MTDPYASKLDTLDEPEPTSIDGELTELIDRFLASKATGTDEEGRPTGPYTDSARSVLRRFETWMATQNRTLADLDGADGARICRQYARRLAKRHRAGSISAATAERYFAYISACLSFGIREGMLSSNPALTDTAREEVPEDTRSDRSEQQFWSREQRQRLVQQVEASTAEAVDEGGFEALVEARDRALAYTLAYAGVRGAEVLRYNRDGRDGRQGLTWARVEYDRRRLWVLGKDGEWEGAPLPSDVLDALRRLERIQQPGASDWPVFLTDHRPSLYSAARDQLAARRGSGVTPDDVDLDSLRTEHGGILNVFREEDLKPPSLTTEGGRSVMRRLTEAAGIDVDGSYLKPHGGRRGIVEEIYRRDRTDAQDMARHQTLAITKESYQHIDDEETAKRFDDHLAEIEGGEDDLVRDVGNGDVPSSYK